MRQSRMQSYCGAGAILLLLAATPTTAEPLSGRATVTDGDTLRIGEHRIRVAGIDAPELRQTCSGPAGETYECGRDSAAVLVELTRGRIVTCQPNGRS